MDNTSETNKPQPMIKYAATYGLIFGLALILLATIDYVFKIYGQNTLLTLLNYAVMIGGVALFTVMYRDKALGGYITYGQAVGFGCVLMIFASFISGVFSYILNLVDPLYMEKQLEIAANKLAQQGYDDYVIEQSMRINQIVKRPGIVLISSIIGGALIGTIISLITSIFIQKKKSIF
ncbi:MAG: DUF4199 domain-containing protein [Prevotellaceae bacterium]|jgi:hypothetical protein|nr:DUF4199 domain-containing protein [Prevotellaceae bacterium]